jgi:hypothetical protein
MKDRIKRMMPNGITGLEGVNLPLHLLSQFQLSVLLNACSIVKKFLSDDVHLPEEEADNH